MLRTLCDIGAYVGEMLPLALAALAVLLLCGGWRRRRLARLGLVSPRRREVALALFVAFCGGLAVLTLFPAGFWSLPGQVLLRPWRWGELVRNWRPWETYPSRAELLDRLSRLGDVFAPFQEIRRAIRVDRYWLWFMLLGNLAMFMPLGLFPQLLWRRWRWWKSLLAGLCASAAVETVQLFIGRSADVDDVILNTAGAGLGWLAAWLYGRLRPRGAARYLVQEGREWT